MSEPAVPASAEEADHRRGVTRLEAEVVHLRRSGARATRELYDVMVRELRAAERALRVARTRGARLRREVEGLRADNRALRRRVRLVERELEAFRQSRTVRARQAVTGVVARVRRPGP